MQPRTFLKTFILLAGLCAGTLLVGGRPAAANPITTVDCSPFGSRLTFAPEVLDSSLQNWWVDLNYGDSGWLPGTFLTSGPLPASASSYRWDGLSQERYYFRITEQMSDGRWYVGSTYLIQITGCTPPSASMPAVIYPGFWMLGPGFGYGPMPSQYAPSQMMPGGY